LLIAIRRLLGAKGATMSRFELPPLHDFPDRAIRRLLEDVHNLRDLLAAAFPEIVERFDFEKVEPVPRTFLLDDWRRRESDLLFRVPFASRPASEPERYALICVLIEHQSKADPLMPLRTLLYAVLYWQEEWRVWETAHDEGEPLRLTPVLPIVFHTGGQPWRSHRALAELIEAPEPMRTYVPGWQPLFWDLAERTTEELLEAAGAWIQALAVLRAERDGEAEFEAVFAEVLRRLEGLREQEAVRWHALVGFVLSWAVRRRPGQERQKLWETARDSQSEAAHREEIREMSETIEQTWEQELLAEGGLRNCQRNLRLVLRERFGAVPEALDQRIEQIRDLERLENGIRQALHIQDVAELEL
jgi:Putative transposase, YhgA-like